MATLPGLRVIAADICAYPASTEPPQTVRQEASETLDEWLDASDPRSRRDLEIAVEVAAERLERAKREDDRDAIADAEAEYGIAVGDADPDLAREERARDRARRYQIAAEFGDVSPHRAAQVMAEYRRIETERLYRMHGEIRTWRAGLRLTRRAGCRRAPRRAQHARHARSTARSTADPDGEPPRPPPRRLAIGGGP